MKPKIVLARCPIDKTSIAADQWNMPLDLLLLAKAVDERCDVEIIDGSLCGPETADRLAEANPTLVGLTYTALSSKSLARLSTQAKAQGALVVVGGQPAAAASASLALEPTIDAVCVGDGQPTIQTLSAQLAEGRIELGIAPNLLLRQENQLFRTPVVIEDVWRQKMPPRQFAGVEPESYMQRYPESNTLINMSGNRAANLYSKRGCTRRCSFCARQDKGHRARSPAIVAAEIRNLVDQLSVDYILDTSDTWIDVTWARAFATEREEFCIENVPMMVFADARDVTPEAVKSLTACGVDSVLFGIESGSERILRRNGKFIARQDIVKAVDELVNAGIKVSCSFVLGLLDEDEESLEETVDLTRELHTKPGVVCYGNTIMPLMGSWLWSSAFPPERTWPSFITRALDYDLEAARDLYIAEATKLPNSRASITEGCEAILSSSNLPVKEYAR